MQTSKRIPRPNKKNDVKEPLSFVVDITDLGIQVVESTGLKPSTCRLVIISGLESDGPDGEKEQAHWDL